MVKHIVAGPPVLRVQNALGEGCVWDTKQQRLYWVDIDGRRIFTFEPSSGIHGFESFEGKISSLTLKESGDGLLGASEYTFIEIPWTSLPFPPSNSLSAQSVINLTPTLKASLREGTNRFNDGYCDPAGRFLAGTMGANIGEYYGTIYSFDGKGLKKVLDNVTCTNGAGWTDGGRTMIFTDSWTKQIMKYDYDLATGVMSKPRLFNELNVEDHGWPDGLCMDSQGGIWSARWQGGKVIRFLPSGEVDLIIEFPKAWNMTCCCFGGPNMDELYVTSASSRTSGDSVEERPEGGDLFVVKELGFIGKEKYRFRG